jgi:hypothetical protein
MRPPGPGESGRKIHEYLGDRIIIYILNDKEQDLVDTVPQASGRGGKFFLVRRFTGGAAAGGGAASIRDREVLGRTVSGADSVYESPRDSYPRPGHGWSAAGSEEGSEEGSEAGSADSGYPDFLRQTMGGGRPGSLALPQEQADASGAASAAAVSSPEQPQEPSTTPAADVQFVPFAGLMPTSSSEDEGEHGRAGGAAAPPRSRRRRKNSRRKNTKRKSSRRKNSRRKNTKRKSLKR